MTEKELVKLIIRDSLKKQAKYFGLEKLEEIIKEVYKQIPTTKDIILKEYYNILKGKII